MSLRLRSEFALPKSNRVVHQMSDNPELLKSSVTLCQCWPFFFLSLLEPPVGPPLLRKHFESNFKGG